MYTLSTILHPNSVAVSRPTQHLQPERGVHGLAARRGLRPSLAPDPQQRLVRAGAATTATADHAAATAAAAAQHGTIYNLYSIRNRASNEGSQRFHNHGEDPTYRRLMPVKQIVNSVLNVKVLVGPFNYGRANL